MLTADELSAMRTQQDAAQPETGVAIQRVTEAADGYGGWTSSWATVATVTGRKAEPRSAQELRFAERYQAVRAWIVTVPYNTDVRAKDQLVVGGVTLRVEEVLAPHSWETARRVWCTEVN